ncbi:MAG: hypothetical protein ACXWNR_08170 [Candidatus Limnocylindrales bacterium]
MNLNASRYLRSFAIAAFPLLLIAGAAFASSNHTTVVADPTAGHTAKPTDAAGATKSLVEHVPDASGAPEANESSEPTKAPEANEPSEPTKAPEASEKPEATEAAEMGDIDDGPAASASATIGHDDDDFDKAPGAGGQPGGPSGSDKDAGFSGKLGTFPGGFGGHR